MLIKAGRNRQLAEHRLHSVLKMTCKGKKKNFNRFETTVCAGPTHRGLRGRDARRDAGEIPYNVEPKNLVGWGRSQRASMTPRLPGRRRPGRGILLQAMGESFNAVWPTATTTANGLDAKVGHESAHHINVCAEGLVV